MVGEIRDLETARIAVKAALTGHLVLSTLHTNDAASAVTRLTEMGVKDPVSTFSACYGAAFLVWHPFKYATMLADKMQEHGTKVWLINTGWSGGSYGVGQRMDLGYTRAIIDAIHAGDLDAAETARDPVFGLDYAVCCPGVPTGVMRPRDTWKDKAAYDATAKRLSQQFRDNFVQFADETAPEVVAAGPK